MTDAILQILEWINDMILGVATDGASLTTTLSSFMPIMYGYTITIMENVILPVAYIILALFFVLELHKASIRVEGMGGTTNLGAEMVFKILFKMVLCKIAVDSISLILNAIYGVTTHLTSGIAGVMGGNSIESGGIDTIALEPIIDSMGFWAQLGSLVLILITLLIVVIAVVLANIIIVARFIEIYVYFAIAPIPVATLPHEEMSSIGKNFLKSFAAVCIQGSLIFIVLSFFPILFNSAFLDGGSTLSIMGELTKILGYSFILIIAVFSTGKWAKSICNAM